MRRHAPATARNRQPILEVLQRVLPASGLVLEVASGTGEHAVYMAHHLPGLTWQPSDADEDAVRSIDMWRDAEGSPNLRPALHLDATSPQWPIESADALVCINMVHIAPWQATLGLLEGAAHLLPEAATLFLYGPYLLDHRPTAASNLAFDESLRARNPAWGLRRVADLEKAAEEHGFHREETIDMPANNVSLIFRAP